MPQSFESHFTARVGANRIGRQRAKNSVTQSQYKTSTATAIQTPKAAQVNHLCVSYFQQTTPYTSSPHSSANRQPHHLSKRNHGCPRSFRKLQRVSACAPRTTPIEVFTKNLHADCDCAFRVGVFSTLTNSYALVAVGASENFYR